MVKLSEKEKAAHKAAFKAMSPAEKAEHIFTYHKWTILLVLLVLLVIGSTIHRQLTQKKPVLYMAVINTTFGEDVEKSLTEDFLAQTGGDTRRQEVYLYRDLYLSEDADTLNHEYAYASKVKLGGAISAEKLDLVLMNREAYDIFSRQGYLLELTSLSDAFSPYLTENDVILSDNSVDYLLGNALKQLPMRLQYLLFRCFVTPVLTEISISVLYPTVPGRRRRKRISNISSASSELPSAPLRSSPCI